MFQWIRSKAWLPEFTFFALCAFVFGTLDYFVQGVNALTVTCLFALMTFFFRRASIIGIFVFAAASFGVYWFQIGPNFGELGALFALFLVAAEAKSKRFRFSFLASIFLGLGAITFFQVQQGALPPSASVSLIWSSHLLAISLCLLTVLGTYSSGRLLVLRDSHVGSGGDLLHLQNVADSSQLLVSELESRLAIAQDISELVIQNVSAVISRAEGGIYAAKSSPDSAVRSLERVLENAQNANNEVRRLNDLLRQERGVSVAPPGLSDLEGLALRYREQGFSCSFANEGKPFALNQGAQLAVYRIAFEALKFFAIDATKAATLSIDLIWSENGLQVLVKDDSTSLENRKGLASSDADASYSVLEDLEALVEPINNSVIASCRARASIYGGSAELTKVPGVGHTLSAFFPDLRLIASDSSI